MKPKTVILGVLGLLIGLGAGFLIWGNEDVVELDSNPYLELPPDREDTYMIFKQGDDWYVNEATPKDPLIPCLPLIDPEADCTPVPNPCRKPKCLKDIEVWTKWDPNGKETIGVLPNCR